MQINPWLVLLAIIVITPLVYFINKLVRPKTAEREAGGADKSDAEGVKNAITNLIIADASLMPRERRRILILYLLAFGSALVFMLVSLNSVDFPDAAVIPQPTEIAPSTSTPSPAVPTAAPGVAPGAPTAAATQSPTPAPTAVPTPALFRIFAESKGGSPPTLSLTAYGNNFSRESKVRFNMQPVPSEYISDKLIAAALPPSLSVGVGSVTVDVMNPGGLTSNALTVPIDKPRVPLNVFFLFYPWITREVQLLLLAIFAGALGSYLHAIMSLGDYIASRQLTASWFWWYISRPFLGMAMALVFYAVLRGGFLAGSPADAKVVNPFGVLAIGALVGMFSDKSAQKLGEIFDVVFRSGVERGDKLVSGPAIERLDPDKVPAGGKEPVTVKIIGDRLSKVSTVLLDAVERKPSGIGEKTVSFKLMPEDMAKAREIQVTAVSSDGGVSGVAILTITDPSLSPENNPPKPADNGGAGNDEANPAGNEEAIPENGEAKP